MEKKNFNDYLNRVKDQSSNNELLEYEDISDLEKEDENLEDDYEDDYEEFDEEDDEEFEDEYEETEVEFEED